jgi:hypothetical protein
VPNLCSALTLPTLLTLLTLLTVLTLLNMLTLLTMLTLQTPLTLFCFANFADFILIRLPRADLGERDLARLMASVPSPANLLVTHFTCLLAHTPTPSFP